MSMEMNRKLRLERLTILVLLFSMALWLLAPVAAADEIAVSTDGTDVVVSRNSNLHYINGIGMLHSPATSWLYENENGGVTLVQYVSKTAGVTVAEYDSELDFMNVRSIPVPNLTQWGGFYAGETYNFLVYAVDSAVIHVDQYTKDWIYVSSCNRTLSNTKSFITNDLDITEGNGSLFIVTNHYMDSGHMANMRLQINESTMAVTVEQTGTATYNGYCSHSYVPETVWADGILYALDRCDSIPGLGIYVSSYNGSLSQGITMGNIRSMAFNDWGNLGSCIPAGKGVLTAYNYAPGSASHTSTNIFLNYYCSADKSNIVSQTVQVTSTGGAGTPFVAAVTDTYGYVLWNPDIRSSAAAGDTLFYARYDRSDDLTVGEVQSAEENALSDCDPI